MKMRSLITVLIPVMGMAAVLNSSDSDSSSRSDSDPNGICYHHETLFNNEYSKLILSSVEDEMNGQGQVIVNPNGSVMYEGEVKDNPMLKLSNGSKRSALELDIHSGSSIPRVIENDKPINKGTIKWPDGSAYEGDIKDDKMHGKGAYKWPNGSLYKGEWKDDKRNGKGTYKWPDGRVYEGEWKDDNMHGNGTFKSPSGDSYKGEWKDDKIGGKGTYYYQNGNVYNGELSAGMRHGGGTMTYANGDIYDGEWKVDRKDGKGKMKFSNGDEYKGEFRNNQLHGKGVMTYAAGDLLKSSGEWKNGKKYGKFEDIVREEVYYYDEFDKVKLVSLKSKNKDKAQSEQDVGLMFALFLILLFVGCMVPQETVTVTHLR